MPRVDPRLQDAAGDSVNDELRDRAIRHALFLERLKTNEAQRVRALLDRAVPDVIDQIERRLRRIEERGFDLGPATTRRLQELASVIGQMLEPQYRAALEDQQASLVEIARSEVDWQRGAINTAVGLNVDMVTPNVGLLREIALRRPFQGRLLREWYRDLDVSQRQRLRDAVRIGMVEGESTRDIARRVRGASEIGRRQAEAVTRTAVNHVSSHARAELFRQNSNVVQSVQWISTLDSRTTAICRARDGKTWPIDSGPRPPAHIGCRSTVTPVLRSWRSLGIDADEMPESTRASMTGQVPESLTYNDWLRRRVNAGDMDTVREALGETRAKLFAAGGLDVERFVDRRGRKLTLAQLREREADAFEAAGVEI